MTTTFIPFTIAGSFGGEQDAQFCIATIDIQDLERILEAARFIKHYQEKHGGFCNFDHCASQPIKFLSEFPDGHGFGMHLDEDPYGIQEFPVILPGFAEAKDAFTKDAEEQNRFQRTEATGFVISLHGGVRIRGYEKHGDAELHSEDILPLIIHHLESTYPDSSAIITMALRSVFPHPDA